MIDMYRLLDRESNGSFMQDAYLRSFASRRTASHPDSACALELARRGASHSGARHAGFADINTLAEVSCVKLFVTLGDASTLLIRILNVLRTRCGADGYCDQNNEGWRLHGEFPIIANDA
jgi:hypothetical protein